MKRLLPLVALVTLVLLLPAPAGAADPNWGNALKAFKEGFKSKNPLRDRRKAVKDLVTAKDARGIKELLKVVSGQQKYADKLRKEWAKEEEAWQEKTRRIQEQIDRKVEQAKGGQIQVTDEEDEWLGLTEARRQNPKMLVEKVRIQNLYKEVLNEEDLVLYIHESAARLVNSLEGDERAVALRDAISAARKAPSDEKPLFAHLFSYVQGDDATEALEDYAKDTDAQIAVYALEALGRQNSERGMSVLIERLEDPRWQVRSAVLKGLSYFKDPRVMDALLTAAKKEEGVLQRKYFAAMARIVQEQMPGTVEAWESFWKENREDYIRRWAKLPKGEPVEGEPPDIPIDTSLGSTSFYGIRTNSKHIIFVVDISGSMGPQAGTNEQGEQRIDVARKELTNAVQSLSAADEDERGAASFNIVLYSDGVTVYKPGKMVVATKTAKEKAFDWINENVKATGNTNIFDAVEQAFNIISDTKDDKNLEKGADTIFLMTDGFPNRGKFFDPELILREIREMNKTRKLTIHTIGVGEGHNAPFLRQMAAENDGQYLSR